MFKGKEKNYKKKKSKSKNNQACKEYINSKTKTLIPSLSKQEPSSNWLSFMKSHGSNSKVFANVTSQEKKKKCNNIQKFKEVTKVVALDCEMVSDINNQDMLARVSLVNYHLNCVYDKFVKPVSKVGDYRTKVSGIREADLEKGEDFDSVRQEVKNMLYNKILVGHALHNDFRVLKFGHSKLLIRDTSRYETFRKANDSKSPSLKKLAKMFLGESIQEGEHNSIEDARTVMKLYKKFRHEWEISLNSNSKKQFGTAPQPAQMEM